MGLPAQSIDLFLHDTSDGLAFPMTILYALEKLNDGRLWTEKESLTVHVGIRLLHGSLCIYQHSLQTLGATHEEVTRAMLFEEILHRLPMLKSLKVIIFAAGHTPLTAFYLILVGPGMIPLSNPTHDSIEMNTCL